MTRSKTVVLGVDSLDLVLVERWVAQGLLPFFSSLLRKGPLVRLSAVSRVLQGAVWHSLLTGRSPGQHGLYYQTQLSCGSYDLEQVHSRRGTADPYYSLLHERNIPCAMIDVPCDRPRAGFRGLQVVDWLPEFQFWSDATATVTVPAELAASLPRWNESGGYGPSGETLEAHERLRQRLEASIDMKAQLVAEVLRRPDIEHVFAVFAEPHKGGHFLWKYHDPTHPDHVAAGVSLQEALLCLYQRLDTRLAELSGLLSPNDNLIVLSDHGMQANYRGDHLVGRILEKLGLSGATALLDSPRVAHDAPVRSGWGNAMVGMRGLATRAAPDFVRRHLRHRFGRAARVDWRRVQVFQLPTDRNTYLRVNLQGREPEGSVCPGREYEQLLTRIESEFRALINVDTGRPAVKDVFRVPNLYPGPRSEDLPDMAILWSAEAPLHAVQSPRIGRIRLRVIEDRSGNHREEGFLLARGPAFNVDTGELHGDVLQIPSTLLALHGIPTPAHYEKGPLRELLASAYQESAYRNAEPLPASRSTSRAAL